MANGTGLALQDARALLGQRADRISCRVVSLPAVRRRPSHRSLHTRRVFRRLRRGKSAIVCATFEGHDLSCVAPNGRILLKNEA